MNCWICGNPADSGEHKIKKSLLIKTLGRGPYIGANAISHIKDGKEEILQGPKSDRLKFMNTICAECNNKRTQRFDLAYDRFFNFFYENKEEIIKFRVIDFAKVYGDDWEIEQRRLFKYFVKLFGCDLAESNMLIPDDLRNLLDEKRFLTKLRITFAINEDKVLIGNELDGLLGIGELLTTQRNLENKDDPKYMWQTYFSFLHIFYWYDFDVKGSLGVEWIANSRYVYLGYFYPLTSGERKEIISDYSERK